MQAIFHDSATKRSMSPFVACVVVMSFVCTSGVKYFVMELSSVLFATFAHASPLE